VKTVKNILIVLTALVLEIGLRLLSVYTAVSALVIVAAPGLTTYWHAMKDAPLTIQAIVTWSGLVALSIVCFWYLSRFIFTGLVALVRWIWPFDQIAGRVLDDWLLDKCDD
jgi:hypothetical protein